MFSISVIDTDVFVDGGMKGLCLPLFNVDFLMWLFPCFFPFVSWLLVFNNQPTCPSVKKSTKQIYSGLQTGTLFFIAGLLFGKAVHSIVVLV